MSGSRMKSKGGLTKDCFKRNKNGKIVSKKASAAAKKRGAGWIKAVMKARAQLGVKGFMAIKKGTKLYKLAKSMYTK